MTETFQNTAEGGTNTTAVTTGNSGGASGDAWTSVNAAPTFTTVSPLDGSVSYLFTNTSQQFLAWDAVSAYADLAYYFYFDFPSNPVTTLHQLLQFRSLSASLGSVNLTTSGELSVVFASGGAGPTAALTAGTRYRVEGQITAFGGAAGTHNLQVYVGTSTTAFDSLAATGGTSPGTCQRIRWGRPAATTTLATGMRTDTLKVVFGSATPITPIISSNSRQRIYQYTAANRSHRFWQRRRATITQLAGVRSLSAFTADVTGTTTAVGLVVGVVGDIGSATGSTAGGGTATAVVGVIGSVTGQTTTGGTVTGVVARFAQVTGSTAGAGTVAGTAGVVGTVTGSTTSAGTVTALVARTGAVTGNTVAGGTVNASTVTGLLGDVSGTTTAAGATTATMAATAATTGSTASAGTVAGIVNANGQATGTTVSSGTVTAGTISAVTGTTTMVDSVAGQVAATTTITGTTTGGGTVVAAVGKLAAVTGTTAATGTLVRALGTSLAATGNTTADGALVAVVARTAQVTGTTVAAGDISVGAATVGTIRQGRRATGGPRLGRRPVGGPRALP